MPQVELSLRRNSSLPTMEVAAWYLPGSSAARWLQEISLWPVDQTAIRIIVIQGESTQQPEGVLAIPPTVDFSPSGYGVPFRRLQKDIFVPVDAELFPRITAAEVAELFSGDYVYVWIPGRGLTAAEAEQVFRPSDFIDLSVESDSNWDRAVAGFAFAERLIAVFPEQTQSVEDILHDGKDDIGDRASDLPDLPKAPQEPMSGIAGKAVRAGITGVALPLRGIANMVSAIGNKLPGEGTSIPGLKGLGDVADKLLNHVSKSLESVRHKEISRLLHMLDSDPDQGLKYAIPFGGGGEHRGLGAPGGRLGMRNVNFNLGQLGGGEAADYWDMSWDYQQKLISKYRDLASRETRLGRYRRAAYIYAQLLGDMSSAAATLEQGGHYREASILYRDRLNNRRAAAECLERGKLWNEAIAAYRDLNLHEKVGDLLTILEQEEAATKAYHLAAEDLLAKGDQIGAARLYEEKIGDANLALATLDSAWPHSSQAKLCLQEGFALRARLGAHASAQERVESLFDDAGRLSRHAEVADLLADVFEQYPDSNVSEESARLSKQIIVNRVKAANQRDTERFTKTLCRLTPDDRLLPRDSRRFVELQFTKRASLAPVQQFLFSRAQQKLQLVNQVSLELKGVWQTASQLSDVVLVAGVLDNRIVFAKVDATGKVEKNLTPWAKTPVSSDTHLLLFGQRSPLQFFAIGEQPLDPKRIFTLSEPDGRAFPVSAGTPPGHNIVWGATSGSMGQTWSLESRKDPALVCVGLTGTIVSTQSIPDSNNNLWGFAEIPLPMHATRDRVLLGVGNVLLSVKNQEVEELERFPSRIISMNGGRPYASPTVTVSLETGAALVRYGFQGLVRPFATEMTTPQTLLNQGSFVIAADENQIEVYESNQKKTDRFALNLTRQADHQTGKPIALLPTTKTDQFIVITNQGVVSTYSI